ncbi:glycosyltransferase family 2 protein [Enterococcus sp. HY326]|uniref:glycosyltransferase family 2 protein n=1 Tax=Enterococcus sp. HY326 TaxID=2971265 RepID=UPI002240E1E5|nr:glycosyltransferase family 2 protein [Enterococcus sp. HY326]
MTTSFPNHTFVVCAYKESTYLEDCLQSLLNQKTASKIIIYTSTPNDFIQHLAEKYQLELFTKTGGSIGKDWNNALSFVTTQYATIAHQDDYYEATYSEEIMKQFKEKADTLIAYPDYYEWKDGQKIPANTNLKIKSLMLKTMAIFPKSKFWRKRVLAFGNPISCPAVSYNLKALKDFHFDEEMRVSLDWYAWYQIANRTGGFAFVNQKLMFHRIHDESETTASISDNSRTKEDLFMYRLFWPQPIANFLMRYYVKSQNTN